LIRTAPHLFVYPACGRYRLPSLPRVAHRQRRPNVGARRRRQPMTLLGAAAFQWVNPKAWIMVMGAISTYTSQDDGWRIAFIVTLLYMLANLPCIVVWAAFGAALRNLSLSPSTSAGSTAQWRPSCAYRSIQQSPNYWVANEREGRPCGVPANRICWDQTRRVAK